MQQDLIIRALQAHFEDCGFEVGKSNPRLPYTGIASFPVRPIGGEWRLLFSWGDKTGCSEYWCYLADPDALPKVVEFYKHICFEGIEKLNVR